MKHTSSTRNEALSVNRFNHYFSPLLRTKLHELVILQEIGSTNNFLMDYDGPPPGKVVVCLAEQQTAGRGTNGREWQSRAGASFIYSIAWKSGLSLQALAGMSLAVGVCVQNVLEDMGFRGIQLKWPNDLLAGTAKLGGILLETKQEQDGLKVVCGIGINILDLIDPSEIDQEITSLDKLGEITNFSRNELGARLSQKLIVLFDNYQKSGFQDWQARWEELHSHQGKNISIVRSDRELTGTATGVDLSGALQIQTSAGVIKILSPDELSN